MDISDISQFQYMQSNEYSEAVAYAAKNAHDNHEKWYVFLKDAVYICSDLEHVYPFTGVTCVAELHGENL